MNNEWGTPVGLVKALEDYLGLKFGFDLAASEANHKCVNYWEKDQDALQYDWHAAYKEFGPLWLNPPYSRDLIGPFMEKAAEAGTHGCDIVALVRFDPSATWFQKYVDTRAYSVLMLPKRVKFEGATSAYNFPVCAVCYYGWEQTEGTQYWIPSIDWEQ